MVSRWLLAALVLVLVACKEQVPVTTSSETATGLILLNQHWNDQQRDTAWYTSFGSRILPLRWFLALEQADSQLPFSHRDHLQRFGFATAGPSALNPYELPIGLAATPAHQGESWIGLGCSACHSGQVYYQGKTLHIDGGQALIDFQLFEQELVAALQATLNDGEKFQRFAKSLGDTEDLQTQLQQRSERLTYIAAMNITATPYGRGRLDAFGQIFNAVTVDYLGIPDNRREPNAPTSYPFLWGAPHLDLVQWNGSAPNIGPGPLIQNATTALAVFGELNIHNRGLGYESSTEVENLDVIQNLWFELKAPAWPANLFGPIDTTLARQGQDIYQRECVSCHQLSPSGDEHRELNATLVNIDDIGTDPTMARNFAQARAKSGQFEGEKLFYLLGPTIEAEAYNIDLVIHATLGALLNKPWQSIKAGMLSFHKVMSAPNRERPVAYKARPLSGIWASAPYLHNGSVPTLAAMLSTQRPGRFPVGKVEFDPGRVGISQQALDDAQVSWFDTTQPGNSNTGHLFGTNLAAAQKQALLEYLKTL